MTKNQELPASNKKALHKPKKALLVMNGKADFTPTVVDETRERTATAIVGDTELPAKAKAAFTPVIIDITQPGNCEVWAGGVQPPAKPRADFEPVEIDETAEWEGLCIGIVGGVQPPKKPSQ